MTYDVVVAADLDWGIGKDSGLPWPRLRGDLAHFRRITSTAADGHRNAIVMGRKTWQSKEVAGRPLPNRLSVVVTRTALAVPDGVLTAASLPHAVAAARADATVDQVFVVGGGQLFAEAFDDPALRWVYLTRIDGHYACDVQIPDLVALGFAPVAWDGATELEDGNVRYRIERLARPRPET